MKVQKPQLDKGLHKTYRIGMIMSWLLSRLWGIKLFLKLTRIGVGKDIAGLKCGETYIPSRNNGPDIRLRSPDYRKALEAPFPAGFNDCYDTLLWARDNADLLNADMSKVMLGGHSAGGGMSAALTWKARDTGDVNVGFQMPIYPMIDDRHITESSHLNAPVWSSGSNKLAWKLYLGDVDSSASEVPDYAAPSRNTNYENFPPSFTFVGDLEPFKDETIAYVEALRNNGATVEFKIFEGCFHGFDGMKASISEEALDFTFNTYAKFYDEYIA